MQLRVRTIAQETEDIRIYELVGREGGPLPPFTAGSHVDVTIGPFVRQYSLCSDPADADRYAIAVQRARDGRGGSARLHDGVCVGDLVEVSLPRNHFPLIEDARHVVLIAGGIGVTPLLAMAHRLEALGRAYEFHVCTRAAAQTAFVPVLERFTRGAVRFHHDGGDARRRLDVGALLATVDADAHVYCCGPEGLMRAVEAACGSRRRELVHFERFGATPPYPGVAPGGFQIVVARSGQRLYVDERRSLLSVLNEAGFDIPSSCETGVCGSCAIRYLAGEPEHRDYLLGDAERRNTLTPCVSRAAAGACLVLDL